MLVRTLYICKREAKKIECCRRTSSTYSYKHYRMGCENVSHRENELRLQEASSIIGFSNRFKIPKKYFNDCLSIVIDCFSYFCDKMRESSCTEAVRSVLSYFLYLKSVF